MNILSINFNHDGAGVILRDGKIAAYVNTERFSRIKKQPGIRDEDLDNLLDQANISLNEINYVVVCNIGWVPSPDIVKRYGSGLEHKYLKFHLRHDDNTITIRGITLPAVINPNHWLLHNALAYYTSPFDLAICFSWDPVGTGTGIGNKEKLYTLEYKPLQRSSRIYSRASKVVMGSGLFGSGKLMGLAPYGETGQNILSYKHIRDVEGLLRMCKSNPVNILSSNKEYNATIAYHAQCMLNEHLSIIMQDLFDITLDLKNDYGLCLSGGTALNSVANETAYQSSKFRNIHLAPACGDDGTAIGGAMYTYHHLLGFPKLYHKLSDLAFSVKQYDMNEVDRVISNSLHTKRFIVIETKNYIAEAAKLLSDRKIVAWFNGPSEVGPRSLGNRSILADPRDPKMKDKINKKIKFRETYRPFAPSVINESSLDYFSIKDSPFMLRVCNVISDKLPSITHIDGSSRVQTVTEQFNNEYYSLLKHFQELTGCPVLLNTSFNIKGEPIVETPTDAIKCFLSTGIDTLVFKNRLLTKV